MPYCFFSNLLIKLYACSVLFIFVLYLARQAMETISVYIACLSNLVAAILRGAAIRLDGSDALNTIKLCGLTPWEISVFLFFSVFLYSLWCSCPSIYLIALFLYLQAQEYQIYIQYHTGSCSVEVVDCSQSDCQEPVAVYPSISSQVC